MIPEYNIVDKETVDESEIMASRNTYIIQANILTFI